MGRRYKVRLFFGTTFDLPSNTNEVV
jgi:hypothetical protein